MCNFSPFYLGGKVLNPNHGWMNFNFLTSNLLCQEMKNYNFVECFYFNPNPSFEQL